MKKAFLFPGQGSQTLGMGIDVAENYPEAMSMFKTASDIAGYDILGLCKEGPIEKLSRTKYTQPAIYTVEAAITTVLKSNSLLPDCLAGHSLGEFAAWFAAGVYSFEDGFKLVSERGRIMESVDPDGVGTMAAIIGLDRDVVEAACEETSGTVVVANINSPQQLVISGEKDAVAAAGAILKEKGAKRVLPLKVSGAFHSPLMDAAKNEFSAIAADIELNDASIPVFSNVSASQVSNADEIRDLMLKQMTSSVRWTEIMQNMISEGVSSSFEAGPGKVLAGLAKRINSSLSVTSVSDSAAITEAVNG